MDRNKIFKELMLNREEKLYKIAFSYMKNESDSLDVVQDTLVKALIKFETIEEYKYFDTWIIKILINTCNDHLRKKREYLSYDGEIEIKSIEKDIDGTIDLFNMLDSLSMEERELLYYRYFEDMRVKDIAERLTIKEGTVKSRLSRIISKLRKDMRREEI